MKNAPIFSDYQVLRKIPKHLHLHYVTRAVLVDICTDHVNDIPYDTVHYVAVDTHFAVDPVNHWVFEVARIYQ